MRNFEEFKELLESPKKIVITTHAKPDADALGSSLGFGEYLKMKGHQVTVISPTDYPDFLSWMYGNDEVVIFENEKERATELVHEADMICCLDFNSLDRINDMGELLKASPITKVLIDHHLAPEHFAQFEMWSTDAAATAELVYDLIVQLGDKELITPTMAENIYAGLMTDTGSFRHASTSAAVHEIVSELIKLGADVYKVGKLVYDNNSVDRLRLLGFALSERLKVLPAYKTAYFTLSLNDLARFNYKTGDTEGLVNYALSIKDIVFAAVLIENKDRIKMSFRSTGDFSVNDFARENFDGGGHKNAAGGSSNLSLAETEQKFNDALVNYKEILNQPILTHV